MKFISKIVSTVILCSGVFAASEVDQFQIKLPGKSRPLTVTQVEDAGYIKSVNSASVYTSSKDREKSQCIHLT